VDVCPAVSWNGFEAIGVPFRSSVHVPGAVMLVPVFVMLNVPCASGVHVALIEKTGTAAAGADHAKNTAATEAPRTPGNLTT
jgi:hypothetical protein